MAERYEVLVKVISQRGTCEHQHKVGDEWVIGNTTPAGICLGAFDTMYPYALTLMTGGSFTWSSDPDVATLACPDPENPVVFELRRLRK